MGKVGQRSNTSAGTSSTVHGSARRRLIKVTSSGGSRKPRGSSGKLAPPPPPPPPQSLVLDEDSGFGGDQSLDAEPALNYSPALSPPALASSAALSSSIPHPILSLTGLPAVSKSSHSSSLSSSASLSQLSLSSPLSLGSSGSLANLSSILPSLAMVPQACVDKLRPGVCPKNEPGIMDMGGEEAQELPNSSSVSAISSSVPPLISFRDVSLLSSLHTFKGNSSNNSSLLCVDGGGGKVRSGGGKGGNRPGVPPNPPLLTGQLSARSSDGSFELRLERQPEEQHRARYQTEGSRGAVKDRSGAGHPTVKLVGYNKRTTLQVFVGSDTGKCGPHMFYQVCRVTGKNSTPCRERRVEGTAVIETVLDPDTEMTMSCDCVGILKERNVDVEHRFKSALSRGRKKSTKCRLVFRAFVTLPSGVIETLQIVSHPIACTQPPGVPEICRKSLNECGVAGGDEMFILGKNFLKDALVVFQHRTGKAQPIWEERVLPDKDTLQPIHLVVKVPGYCDQSIREEVTVDVMVSSGGRTSESHPLTFLPTPASSAAPIPVHAPVLSQSTKRELNQLNDTWEDKPLPKGVSPCALQINRHYTETGMMPSSLPDFTSPPTAAPTQPHFNTTQVCVSGAPSSVKTSRVVLNTTKKVVSSGLGLLPMSSQLNQTPDQIGGPGPQQQAPGDNLFKQESSGSPGVSLEVVVEMLKVIQKFPTGSPIHTSVLQLVERLLQSMRDNLPQNKLTPNPIPSYDQLLTQPSPITPTLDKSSKFLDHLTPSQPQLPLMPSGSLTTGTIPMTTSVSLLPLTVFSTVYAGPKVARVAPVAPVAPTTVVSSPALTRTVRVCVAEEPPLKKAREETVSGSANYQLMSGNQCSTFTPDLSTTSLLADKVPITTHDTLPTSTPTTRHQDLSTPHQVLSSSLVPTHQLTHPSFASTLHTVYQPFLQTLPAQASTTQQIQPETKPLSDTSSLSLQQSHTNNLTPPQPNTQLLSHHTSRQNLMTQQTSDQSLTRIPTRQTTLAMHHLPQQSIIVQQAPQQQSLNVSGNTKGSSHTHSLSVDSNSVSGEVSDPLLSQAPLCPLLPPPTTQKTLPSTNCPSSSALTHSDPLLSQSSPVTPLRMEARPGLPAVRTEGTAGEQVRTRPDSLMTPTPPTTTAQVTMQNEVTSAINLSETELLNYFDPNCFDNV